jgi:exodeoxyribonuclease V beta subunit
MAAHMQSGRMASTDDQQLRLESDARAVQIITIHKSKGLQFDVVFCPFTWVGAYENDELVAFHNPDDEKHLTLALGPDIPPPYKRQGLREDLAENLRLLYVALTRARKQCYWVWGRIRNTAYSAPAFLLHGPAEAEGGSDWEQALSRKMQEATDARLLREIKEMISRSRDTIALAPLPDHAKRLASKPAEFEWAPERVFERNLDLHWRIASFSSLTAGHGGAPGFISTEPPEKDRDKDRDQNTKTSDADAEGNGQRPTHAIFDFPKGTRAGLFFHDVLENWDFNTGGSDAEATGRQALINTKLTTYGFERYWAPAIDDLLCDLAVVNLPNPFFPVTFQEAVNGRRLNEMAFYFPLNRITPAALQQAFARSAGGSPAHADFAAALKQIDFMPVEGFLKGYVDLIFEYRGRYFVVDWKSNHLGNRKEAYAPEHLEPVMAETHYFLQYHLYVVALDQVLRQRIPDYDFDRHFGGVYYIFLRGIDRRAGSSGIHYAMPDADLIGRLREFLVAEKSRGLQGNSSAKT